MSDQGAKKVIFLPDEKGKRHEANVPAYILDDLPGFIIAVSTMYYVFIKYAKLWELQKGLKEG